MPTGWPRPPAAPAVAAVNSGLHRRTNALRTLLGAAQADRLAQVATTLSRAEVLNLALDALGER